ncbi:sce7726 family protein [Brachyspira hyodysenteriae]|nr:sce7726 family protein [Brachyspira hyodysenteriae]MDA0062688.1 sce7726 family protein [Brachyspira hyodysenteriae]MDA0071540.1 sce7726 family protein [Brachyspira hyodysenteriae]MDA0095667.1 sce7726 family protein [Brachyspira hyodysenteriae]
MKTREIDIRNYLHSKVLKEHEDMKDAKIIDELKLCQGDAIIDIAVFNGSINGYEIKSDSDTLERLPKQIEIYNKVFNKMTIVTGDKYIDNIFSIVPEWWGIIKVINGSSKIDNFVVVRENKENQHIDSIALIQLLWKDEILELLELFNIKSGVKGKSKKFYGK